MRVLKCIVVLCLGVCSSSGADALAGDIASATCSARIVSGITGTKDTDNATGGNLVFGVVQSGQESGSVVIHPSTQMRSHTGGVLLVPSVAGPATFSIEGDPNAFFSISLPDDGMVALVSGEHSMPVNHFISSLTPTSAKLDAEGHATVNVGGELEIDSNQPAGDYAGTFNVAIAYQ